MVAYNGWPNVIHACKNGEKKRRLAEDKRWDSKEKEGMLLGRKRAVFGEKSELAR